jgi:hypothetical protein
MSELILSAKTVLQMQKTEKQRSDESIAIWKSPSSVGSDWFREESAVLSLEELLVERYLMINMIDAVIDKEDIGTLIEIGVGDGRFLDFLCDKYNEKVEQFIGFDLNEQKMIENSNRYDNRISFHDGFFQDGIVNIDLNNNSLLVVVSKTLTLMTQSEIISLLKCMKKLNSKTYFIFYEKSDMDMDLEVDSRLRGCIYFYSHNYVKMITDCQGKIVNQKIESSDNPFNKTYDLTVCSQFN